MRGDKKGPGTPTESETSQPRTGRRETGCWTVDEILGDIELAHTRGRMQKARPHHDRDKQRAFGVLSAEVSS